MGLAFAPVVLLFPPYIRQILAGAWTATIVSVVWVSVFVGSGSAYRSYGGDAERWTAEELWKCRSLGWKTVSHVVRKGWDIDHVAIGPGGILVVQTKWTSDAGPIGPDLWSFDKAISDLREAARSIGLQLYGKRWEDVVRPVIVYWGPRLPNTREEEVLEVDGITITGGNALGRLVGRLGSIVVADPVVQVDMWANSLAMSSA